ncbi:alpha/beta hydrolase [Actinocrispum sp. NPDC049592]|uniref:alpha/beta fold hydrolase n=1 Tax=Actinocrispum sp. NPDC049592 TaxID=3154835 RepID=UPI00343DBE62
MGDVQLCPTWTETAWGRVHALTAGSPDVGELVVVPGLGVSAYLRESVVCAANAGYRAWLPDPPGFGGSGNPPRPLTIPDIAAALVHWLRLRELRSVVLIGHSCGTQVAAQMAVLAPDLVDRLVLGSPTVDPRYRSWPRAVIRWRRDGRLEPASLVRTQRPEWRRAGVLRLMRLARSMMTNDLETTLAQVSCPVTVLRGDQDPLCTRQWARDLADDFVEVPGPHAFPYETPDVWVKGVRGDCRT